METTVISVKKPSFQSVAVPTSLDSTESRHGFVLFISFNHQHQLKILSIVTMPLVSKNQVKLRI